MTHHGLEKGNRLPPQGDRLTNEDQFQTNELSRPASSRLVHKAQQQIEAGDLAAAAKTVQRAVDLDPHPVALELLGDLWMKLNQPERAIIPLAAAVTLDQKGGAASALEVLEATRDDD